MEAKRTFYFRSARDMDDAVLTVAKGSATLFSKRFAHLRPPEMERLTLKIESSQLSGEEPVLFHLEVNANA